MSLPGPRFTYEDYRLMPEEKRCEVIEGELLAQERRAIMDPAGGLHGAPDLVVEILSPSTAGRDLVLKRKLYAKYGVKEYWVADPGARSIEVLIYSPAGLETWQVFPTGSTLRSPLLDGLQIPIDPVFAD